ncbi:FAD-dependent oxidoreductase [Vibrio sp. PP-XX7]
MVIGGGVVGCAIAYGLLKQGYEATVLDGGDSEYRASRGNFGLVWLSCKGLDAPHYAAWTRCSVGLWRELANDLKQMTGIDVHLEQNGGYDFYFSQTEMYNRAAQYEQLRAALNSDHPYEIWDRARLLEEEPEIGPDVVGAIYGAEDGHVNPLQLLKAYTQAIQLLGGEMITQVHVDDVQCDVDERYRAVLSDGRHFSAENCVVCGIGRGQARTSNGVQSASDATKRASSYYGKITAKT